MSPEPIANPAPARPLKTAEQRLAELRRALQRQVRRKLTAYEQAALDRAALMTLRAEFAALDARADSSDVVRLDNAARRARIDFERIACVSAPRLKQRTMADINAEIAANA